MTLCFLRLVPTPSTFSFHTGNLEPQIFRFQGDRNDQKILPGFHLEQLRKNGNIFLGLGSPVPPSLLKLPRCHHKSRLTSKPRESLSASSWTAQVLSKLSSTVNGNLPAHHSHPLVLVLPLGHAERVRPFPHGSPSGNRRERSSSASLFLPQEMIPYRPSRPPRSVPGPHHHRAFPLDSLLPPKSSCCAGQF